MILSKVIAQLPGSTGFVRPPKDLRNFEAEDNFQRQLEQLVKEHEDMREKEVY